MLRGLQGLGAAAPRRTPPHRSAVIHLWAVRRGIHPRQAAGRQTASILRRPLLGTLPPPQPPRRVLAR